jgi:hypothetical protein
MICTTGPTIPIIVKQTKLGQFEDNTQNGFMIRAWKALFWLLSNTARNSQPHW